MIEQSRYPQFIRCLSLGLLLGVGSTTSTNLWADTWYQVEVILVGYLNPTDMDKETWPAAIDEPSSSENKVILQYGEITPDLALPVDTFQSLQQKSIRPTADNTLGQSSSVPAIADSSAVENGELSVPSAPLTATADTSAPLDESFNQPQIDQQMRVIGLEQQRLEISALYPDSFYPLAEDSESILESAAARIARSRDMTVLAHYAWNEQIQEKTQALHHPVKIEVNKKFDINVVGEFYLYKSRYIHLEGHWAVQHYQRPEGMLKALNRMPCSAIDELTSMDLLLNQIACHDKNIMVDIPLRAAHVEQSRRMRSDEVHYIDHPLMGVLVTTRRIEDPRLSVEEAQVESAINKQSATSNMDDNPLLSSEITTSIPQ